MILNNKMTVIVDNTPYNGLSGEWGLSILVEHDGKNILVDAGASDLFVENMKALGKNIADVDYGVLSHAHYDHANGIPRFFEENKKAKFYLRETTAENCYAKKFIFKKYIGIPKMMTKNSHKTPGLERIGQREMMYQKTKDGWKPDNFSHEQSLVFETYKGLVIINSCSHGGAVNIINEVKQTFPDKHIYGLIGGFHLFNKSEEEVRNVARNILDTGIDYVCTGHCTKDRAYGIMKEILCDRLQQLHVGLIVEF